jgi:hypothetical protein
LTIILFIDYLKMYTSTEGRPKRYRSWLNPNTGTSIPTSTKHDIKLNEKQPSHYAEEDGDNLIAFDDNVHVPEIQVGIRHRILNDKTANRRNETINNPRSLSLDDNDDGRAMNNQNPIVRVTYNLYIYTFN